MDEFGFCVFWRKCKKQHALELNRRLCCDAVWWGASVYVSVGRSVAESMMITVIIATCAGVSDCCVSWGGGGGDLVIATVRVRSVYAEQQALILASHRVVAAVAVAGLALRLSSIKHPNHDPMSGGGDEKSPCTVWRFRLWAAVAGLALFSLVAWRAHQLR